MSFRDPPAPETTPTELADMLARLKDQMRQMHDDLDSKLDAIAESLEARGADEEAEVLAAERIRSGTAERAHKKPRVSRGFVEWAILGSKSP